MKKIYFLLIILFFVISVNGVAQNKNSGADSVQVANKETKKKRIKFKDIYLGGNIGGGWSNYGGYFEISPTAMYPVTSNLHVGLRAIYIFSSRKCCGNTEKYHDYGAGILSKYYFLKFLYLHAEFQELNFDKGNTREWIPALFIGGGVYQHIGRIYTHFGILWNVLDIRNSDYNSPYQNPVLSVGFGYGL